MLFSLENSGTSFNIKPWVKFNSNRNSNKTLRVYGTWKIDFKIHMHEMYTKAVKGTPQGETLKGSKAASITEKEAALHRRSQH